MRLSLRAIILLAFSAVNLLAVVSFGVLLYQVEKKAFTDGVDQRLVTAAEAVSHILEDVYITKQLAANSITPQQYATARQRLSEYAEEASLAYLYTYSRDSTDNRFYETSTSEQVGTPAIEYATYYTPYDGGSAAHLALLNSVYDTQQPEHSYIHDEFGDFRTYYLPSRAADGSVYIVGADIDLAFIDQHLQESLLHAALLGLAIFLLVFMFSYWLSHNLSKDLRRVSDATESIGRFELDSERLVSRARSAREVQQLMQAVEGMKTNLRSFRKFVPADLVRQLVTSGTEAELGAEKKIVSVFFSDIANFTQISEQLPAEILVDCLGEYLQAMSQEVLLQKGTLDKYIGDAIMAFWGAPHPQTDHAMRACLTALACQQKLRHLREKWRSAGQPEFAARIGIHTGELVVGNIGSEDRLDYTVLGDTVNLASRLESLNKYYDTNILISDATYEFTHHALVARPIDFVAVKGKQKGLMVYELLGVIPNNTHLDNNNKLNSELITASQIDIALTTAYTAAFKLYLSKQWQAACQAFTVIQTHLAKHQLSDRPTEIMLQRCQDYQTNPPPADWSGLHVMQEK